MGLKKTALGIATKPVKMRVELGRMQALCKVLGDANPNFVDPEVAFAGTFGGVIGSPTFINCFRDWKTELVIGELGVDMTKLLHGEQEIIYHKPIRAGQIVEHQVKVVDVEEKQTKALGPTDMFKVYITVKDETGNMLVEAYQTFFVRK